MRSMGLHNGHRMHRYHRPGIMQRLRTMVTGHSPYLMQPAVMAVQPPVMMTPMPAVGALMGVGHLNTPYAAVLSPQVPLIY